MYSFPGLSRDFDINVILTDLDTRPKISEILIKGITIRP